MQIEHKTTLFIRMGTDTVVDEEAFGALQEAVTLTGDSVPYVPAKTNGDPDDCHDAEGGYVDDACVTRDDTGKELAVDDDALNTLIDEAGEAEKGADEAAAEEAYESRYEDY
jgi:hypothetical protein